MLPTHARPRAEARQKHVLVVEDDGAISLAIQLALEDEGYRVTPQHSGTAGLAAAAALHPDVIVLDLMLPDTDGSTMLRELKSWPETGQIPVIFVSAAAGELTPGERGLVEGVVPKPFNLDDLIGVVDRASGRES
jgi:two-component system, OmpR family, KDP operon response regulator KdpE